MKALTVLGFDFGHKHIGVAVGQTVTGTATPLTTIGGGRAPWSAISRIVDEWQPDALVVGHPLNMDGTEQPITHDARRFRNRLNARFSLPVHAADERLSTREARERIRAGAALGTQDHAVAAQVILETWLRERDPPGRDNHD